MIAAIPLGLMSAIYLTQYARPKVRSVLKPVLEVLAGVPTVVYGYFAALTVAPAVREFAVSIGISNASSESALAAGMVMGVMIIPFRSEEHTSELQSLMRISYAVFCLKKNNQSIRDTTQCHTVTTQTIYV